MIGLFFQTGENLFLEEENFFPLGIFSYLEEYRGCLFFHIGENLVMEELSFFHFNETRQVEEPPPKRLFQIVKKSHLADPSILCLKSVQLLLSMGPLIPYINKTKPTGNDAGGFCFVIIFLID